MALTLRGAFPYLLCHGTCAEVCQGGAQDGLAHPEATPPLLSLALVLDTHALRVRWVHGGCSVVWRFGQTGQWARGGGGGGTLRKYACLWETYNNDTLDQVRGSMAAPCHTHCCENRRVCGGGGGVFTPRCCSQRRRPRCGRPHAVQSAGPPPWGRGTAALR